MTETNGAEIGILISKLQERERKQNALSGEYAGLEGVYTTTTFTVTMRRNDLQGAS